jgi:predicted metal-dependent peptidase
MKIILECCIAFVHTGVVDWIGTHKQRRHTMLNYNLDTSDRIIKAKVDLNKSHPFYSYILMNMQIEKTKHTDKIPTMAVGQYGDLYWNKDFVDKLDNDELKFVLAHEVGHISTLTFQRKGTRDMTLWNIATDLVINYMLADEGFRAPKDVLMPDHRGIYTFKDKTDKDIHIDLNNKNAEQVYDDLMKNIKKIKQIVQADGEGGYKGGFDKHLEGDQGEDGESQGKGSTESDQKANENNWKHKAIEAATQAKMRGNISASLERMLGEMLEPVVDWRSKLFAYITNDLPVDYSMRTPSRRFISTGVYTPTVIRESLDLIIGVDISGSIGGEEYNTFISEALGIVNAYRQVRARVIGWACSVLPEDDILVTNDTQEQLLQGKFTNSGGTSLSCLTEYIEKNEYKSRLLVVLTDGYIEQTPRLPDGMDVLFVLSKNSSSDIVKKYGDVTSLNDVTR